MGKLTERLAPALHPGEAVAAIVPLVVDPDIVGVGPTVLRPGLAAGVQQDHDRYLCAHGWWWKDNLLPLTDHGVLALTDLRLLVARVGARGGVEPGDVLDEGPPDQCWIRRYALRAMVTGRLEVVHVAFPDGRFAAKYVVTREIGGDTAWGEQLERIFSALGDHASTIERPHGGWPDPPTGSEPPDGFGPRR